MKEITAFNISENFIPVNGEDRGFKIHGDPGATFSLVIQNDNPQFYNWENGRFRTANAKLQWIRIPTSGYYNGIIHFPLVSANETYTITLWAEPIYETKISSSLANTVGYPSNNTVNLIKTIYQYVDTSITFSLTSLYDSNTYNSFPADVILSGHRSGTSSVTSKKYSIKWQVSIKGGSMSITKQPSQNDFSFTTTRSTVIDTADSTAMELTDVTGLKVGYKLLSVTGSFSLSGAPEITNIDFKNNLVTLSVAQTWDGGGATATFRKIGISDAFETYGASIRIENLAVVLDETKTTTTGAVSASTTIPLTSMDGIAIGSSVSGIGIDNSTQAPKVSNKNSLNVILSEAQTLESGVTLKFKGSSSSAVITGDVIVDQFGDTDFTATLLLDNILKIS
mgnify:CR=1 FL=1